jgi:hypothetical protein
MAELSNVLRQRLASVEQPQVHPDADTLTAYVEHLLAAPERTYVLEHLAACSQCREVMLLLSTPQAAEAAAPVIKVVPARVRSWRPAWGLAASLAGLAIVAGVIIELPRGTKQIEKQATQPAPVASPAGNAPAIVANENTAPAPATDLKRQDDPTVRETASAARPQNSRIARDETARLQPPTAVAPVPSGPYVNIQMFNNDANNVAPYVPDLPTAPSAHMNQAQTNFSSLSNSGPLMAAPAPYEIQSGQPLRITTPSTGTLRVWGWSTIATLGTGAKTAANRVLRKPVPPINGNTFAASAMGPSGQLNPKETNLGDEAAATRSLNGTETGELARSQAFSARAMGQVDREASTANVARAAKASESLTVWKVSDGKLLKLGDSGAFAEAYPAAEEGIQFSTFTSHGADVWAGGSNAALVHSRDSGASWERITLGASATGNINSIEASGMRVVVRSSSGQSWSSADGGKSWVLQD